jgi:hypothetical protein
MTAMQNSHISSRARGSVSGQELALIERGRGARRAHRRAHARRVAAR